MGDRSNHVMNGLHEDEKNVKRTGGRTVVPINTKLNITTVCSSQVVTIVVSVDNLTTDRTCFFVAKIQRFSPYHGLRGWACACGGAVVLPEITVDTLRARAGETR